MVLWRDIKDSAYIYFVGAAGDQSVFEFLGRLEAQVATVHIVLQGERELTIVELLRLDSLLLFETL